MLYSPASRTRAVEIITSRRLPLEHFRAGENPATLSSSTGAISRSGIDASERSAVRRSSPQNLPTMGQKKVYVIKTVT
jgi:hypothetical protein